MTTAETRSCTACKEQFIVTADDFGFYSKMDVPAPTLCPICRFKRRALWRNEMTLYSRRCDLCRKSIISMYHPTSPYTVYCQNCWDSDGWDPFSYGRDYNPTRPFFEQFLELLRAVPKTGTYATSDVGQNINSDYTNFAGGNKDCYLIFNAGPKNENCAYSRGLTNSKDTFDAYYGDALERVYEGVNVQNSTGIAWGQNVTDSLNSWFLRNCSNLQNCFGCVNLRHKSYHFLNEPLAQREYEKRVASILGSHSAIEKFKKQFEDFMLKFPHRASNNLKNKDVTGDYIFESKNCHNCFEASFCEDVRYASFIKYSKDCQDILGHGRQSELLLEGVAVGSSIRVVGSWWVTTSHDIEYSFACRSSKYCFGCDSVRGAQFTILNKQYPEGKYRELRKQIVEELTREGLYGLYFPPEIAPFAYNETVAQDNFPLTKERAIREGFRWQDDLQKTMSKETVQSQDVQDHIKDVPDSIMRETLVCTSCGRNYRIIAQELQFYRTMTLPLPRWCFYCRHIDRIRRRGPMKLFDRTCAKCAKPIKTNYAPERPEIVYCESCYQKEVI